MNLKNQIEILDAAFAVRVERWMRESGVGRQGAAAILGLSRPQLWRLLTPGVERKEKSSVTLERWLRLARALRVPVGDLLNEALAGWSVCSNANEELVFSERNNHPAANQ